MTATATPTQAERSREARSWAERMSAIVPGLGAAALVVSLGSFDGGYFPTAWAPATLALIAASVVMLLVRPAPLGLRELAIPGLLLLLAFWTLTSATWGTATEAVPEFQRTLVYVVGALAFALALRGARPDSILTGLWAGITLVSLYSLGTRLFPERLGVFDPIGGYRLSEPVGYWNALGLLAALGLLLAVGLAARSTVLLVRLLAAASTVPLTLTLYFTFSRGAWLALAGGVVAILVVDPRRGQLAGVLGLVAPWPLAGLLLASSSEPLTESGFSLAAASADGHSLAAIGTGLALAAGAGAALFVALESRLEIPRGVRLAGDGAIALTVVAALAAAVVALGGPADIGRSFAAPPPTTGADLNARLFSISGNGRVHYWRVALGQAEQEPAVGGGAGSYKRYWLANRPFEASARDAHSLYLETLGETGPLGLMLVLAAFVAPLAFALRRRSRPFVPFATGLLVAFGLRAGVDWDWEVPVLTLVALACVAVVTSAGGTDRPPGFEAPRRWTVLGALLVAVPIVGALGLGSRALAESEQAAQAGNYDRAVSAAKRAERLAPWSTAPLLLLGRAQTFSGDREAARETFRRAVAREPDTWRLWLELAAITSGAERRAALARARVLNPLEDLNDEVAAQT